MAKYVCINKGQTYALQGIAGREKGKAESRCGGKCNWPPGVCHDLIALHKYEKPDTFCYEQRIRFFVWLAWRFHRHTAPPAVKAAEQLQPEETV